MRILNHFEYRDNMILTAAQIGVSKWHWDAAAPDCTEAQAKSLMQKKQYDVLPIKNEDGKFTSFHSTQEWGNYDRLNKLNIDNSWKVYYKMSFRDLLKKFAEKENTRFFFLETHDEVVGLISKVNFNSLIVYNYLYREIADIEYRLSRFLESTLDENKVIKSLLESSDSGARQIAEKHQEQLENNQSSSIFQSLYMPHLGVVIKNHVNDLPHQQKALNDFRTSIAEDYRALRNIIAHPINPLIEDHNSFRKLDKVLEEFDTIRDILESTKNETSPPQQIPSRAT